MVSTGVLSSTEIAQYAVSAGFNPTDLPNLVTCVSIAKAESSGRTNAVNQNTDGSTDKGVWQINTVHDEKLPGQDRMDPAVNAQLMMLISSGGTNWQPWSTFNNGAYQRFTSEVTAELTGKTFAPGAGAPSSGLFGGSGISSVTGFFEALTDMKTWVRIGKGVAGAGLIGLGVVAIMKVDNAIVSTVKAVA